MEQRVSTTRQTGFSAIVVMIVIIATLLVAAAGVTIYRRSDTTDGRAAVSTPSESAKEGAAESSIQPADAKQYEGMKQYTNDRYGFSFYYPGEWRVEEYVPEKPSGIIPPELVVSLKVSADVKYNDALILQVVTKPFIEVVDYYSKANSSATAKDTRTDDHAKGKRMTRIVTMQQETGYRSERYMFAVDNKTYMFESANEALNIQRDSEYWKKFEKTYGSLKLQ